MNTIYRALTFGEISPKRGNWRIFGERSGESHFLGKFFEILVKLDGSTWNLCFNCFCLVLCTFGSTCVENDK